MESLTDLYDRRDELSHSMIEAAGQTYYLLQQELEEVEQEIELWANYGITNDEEYGEDNE